MAEGPIAQAFVEVLPAVDAAQFGRKIQAGVVPLAGAAGHAASQAFEKNFKVDAQGKFRSLDGRFASTQKVAQVTSKAIYDDFHGAFDRIATSARLDTDRVIASLNRVGRAAVENAAQSRAAMGTVGHTARGATNEVGFLSSRWSALPRVIRQAQIAAAASLGIVAGFGIKAAASLEQTQVAFAGLLGSQAAGDAFIDRLQKFAAVTPFEFEDLAKSTQKLISLGKTGEEAISILTDIGNAAAAAGAEGQSINRVTLAITQMQAKGKFLAEELNQIAESLPNLDRGKIFEKLAAQSGLTTVQVRELAEKGAIPAKEGIEALLATMREVPGAMGAMDRQAVTLIGRFSTFKDTIKANFSDSLQSSLPILSESLASLTTIVDRQLSAFGPALGKFIGDIAPLIEGLVNAIGPLATTLLEQLGPALAALGPALEPLGRILSSMLEAVGPAITTLASGIAVLVQALAPFSAMLLSQLGPILNTVAVALVEMAMSVLPQFQAALGPLVTALGPFISSLAQILVALLPVLPQLTQLAITSIPSLTAALIVLTPLLELTATVLGKLGPVFAALAAPIVGAAKAIEIFRDLLVDTISVVLRVAAKAAEFVPFSNLDEDLNKAADAVDAFKTKIDSTDLSLTIPVGFEITGITPAQQNQISSQLKAVGHAASRDSDIREAITKSVLRGTTDAAAKVNGIVGNTLGNGLKDAYDKAVGTGSSSAEKAADKAAKAAEKAAKRAADEALKNAQAVADGIKKQLDAAKAGLQKLRDQFAAIRKTVADAFNIDAFESRSARQLAGRLRTNLEKNQIVLQAQGSLQARLGNREGGAQFLQQLFESGNTRLVRSLAGQSTTALADILAKFNQNNSLADKIGLAVAHASKNGNVLISTAIRTQTAVMVALNKALLAALARVEAATKARDRLNAAAGGIFNSATKLNVGEAGREIVLPFSRPGRMETLIRESGLLDHPVLMKMALAHPDFGRPALPAIPMGAPRIGVSVGGAPTQTRLAVAPSPVVKVVKERVVNFNPNIYEVGDAKQTADRIMNRLAAWSER